jgi:uncharacterized protein Smg (DUF494 family)
METARERLINLLAILLEAISSTSEDMRLDMHKFRQIFAAAGYQDSDVRGMLAWVETQWAVRGPTGWGQELPDGATTRHYVRLFSENERDFLTPPAFGYLLDLCQEGHISRHQMESLIHHASMVSDMPLERREIDRLLDQVLFAFPEHDPLNPPVDGPRNIH